MKKKKYRQDSPFDVAGRLLVEGVDLGIWDSLNFLRVFEISVCSLQDRDRSLRSGIAGRNESPKSASSRSPDAISQPGSGIYGSGFPILLIVINC